jgi:hypothetical protein
MAGTALDVEHTLDPDSLAMEIANRFTEWNMFRADKVEEWKELRNYLYATDTRTTTNALLPWSNNTTTPKLTQIMDNLHANYFASLFPGRRWMRWEGSNKIDGSKEKADLVQSYLYHKIDKSDFSNTVSDLLYDYITYGNCFAKVDFVREVIEMESGEVNPVYVGPKVERISPLDIVFNPVASDFSKTPKIIRSVFTLGELHNMVENKPYLASTLTRLLDNRHTVLSSDHTDKSEAFVADGFSSIQHYYGSDYVEVLTMYGDYYDKNSGTYHKNQEIVVLDRAYVMDIRQGASWFGKPLIFHVGWRPRPDNLYAMGPLDNLVGMQYRIDHLENLKADVFDQIAYPVMMIKGDVEDFDWAPGAKIYLGEEGSVGYLQPDGTALQADFQIDTLQNRMEELAGAPKQAMGIRTPGEKTAFEVQSLANSASRIFEHKTAHFERVFLEPILNAMLEVGRRNMDSVEIIPTTNDDTGLKSFFEIEKADILGSGKLVPVGARHFAERARKVQNLSSLHQMAAGDPGVGVHLSKKEIARMLADELGEPELFSENIGVAEQMETQKVMEDAEATHQGDLQDKAERGL